jgi:hypothetical protein
MKKKRIFLICLFLLILVSIASACQKISVPKNAQVIEVPPPHYMDEIPNHIGEFVHFFGEIDIPSSVICDERINDDDACQLHLVDTSHVVNVIVGLNKNNVTYSGKIIYSDGKTFEGPIFGGIPAGITGLVKECDDQKSCVIDVYQLDNQTE